VIALIIFMNKILLVVAFLITIGIVFYLSSTHKLSPIPKATPSSITKAAKVVYLVRENGELSEHELKAYPEIVVTGSFSEFKQLAKERVALWIDKGAINLIDGQWLNEEPQSYYPMVLLGYNDPYYSFAIKLELCCFFGPAVDWISKKLEPGFSVILRGKSKTTIPSLIFFKGYQQYPSVKEILPITNNLLEGGEQPSTLPSSSLIVSPTPPF